MRLNYTDNPPWGLVGEDQEILERVQARRAAMGLDGLIPLDLTLLHAPKIADGWNNMLGAIRGKTSLSDDIRELAMCRTVLINKAWFEWNIHSGLLEKAAGFSAEKMEVVKQLHPSSQGALSNAQWAVLRYADTMTRDTTVPQSLFDEVKAVGFSEQEIVELTMTIAGYNMVSRFLVALDIGELNGKGPEWAQ